MAELTTTTDAILRLSPSIEVLPILHGSGDLAQEVREAMIARSVDCLAVPLPPSVEGAVEQAVEALPVIRLVVLPEPDQDEPPTISFVPVDPCQAVIMGIRVAMGEGIPRAYIDREVTVFEPTPFTAPDPYALKRISLAAYAAALIPSLPPPPPDGQRRRRIDWMAFRLHELELDYDSILCLCHVADWPWLREAYRERRPYVAPEPRTHRPTLLPVSSSTLYFALGELPFVTELYERRRAEVRSDRHLSVDGIKELLLSARTRWADRHGRESQSIANWVTPHLLQRYLQYVRNLALLDRRLTPDLYTLVLAAKQMAGDDFAMTLLETARSYAFQNEAHPLAAPALSVGIGKVEWPDGLVANAKNRLQGPALAWRSLSLRPAPKPLTSRRWALQWNPFRQCSWPPEDNRIESFTHHVREQARTILGADLARVEKFTSSVKDGVDLRETLRHWHQVRRRPGGAADKQAARPRMDIYVKDMPPARGQVEVVLFLFDTPADPARYSWQATWYAEHQEESTLCFYASPFQDRMVGPGIAQSCYGGALFLFPPRPIPNVWEDPRLHFARTLEERLIAAGSLHSQQPHIVLVTPVPPPARWRRIARSFNRRLVPIPLSRFSGQTVDRLRRFHVLNGHEIRSYASKFIRE
ncbi:MAG: hypothetical protein KGO52_06820 [Nitrospirota bacterium]|nr:hypothetical protein [Nitrospirota bacterium]MDE3224297.1 hypothetical protein [Nitrospirota bacterium]MDE3242415.1 hypothetical protein [Nitrospirota bacterium]